MSLNFSPNVKSVLALFLGSLETAIFLSCVVTTIVVLKCIKFPVQIKIFIGNLILLDALTSLSFSMILLGRFNLKINIVPQTHDIYILCNLVFVTLIPLDRLISLVFTIRYQVHITTKRVIIFCVIIWVVLLWTSFVYIYVSDNAMHITLKTLSLILFIIFVTVNIKILLFVRKLNTRIHIANPSGSLRTISIAHAPSPWKNLQITISHAILHISVLLVEILSLTRESFPRRACLIIAVEVVKILNPIFIIYRFKECRLQFRLLLSLCRSQEARDKLRAERNEFYDEYAPSPAMGHEGRRDANVLDRLDINHPLPYDANLDRLDINQSLPDDNKTKDSSSAVSVSDIFAEPNREDANSNRQVDSAEEDISKSRGDILCR